MEQRMALVIGAGPAGLMAAEAMAAAGLSVTVAEAMPTAGRKLLMAGKSGLNLTKEEAGAPFRAAFSPAAPLAGMLEAFGPAQAMEWARGLGQEVFTGSTGRVFPVAMKASPLLRAWLARLAGAGVSLRTGRRWTGLDDAGWRFSTPEGEARLTPEVTVLALGGGSWPRLGSDGGWVPLLESHGVAVSPLRSANAGLRIGWSSHMAPHFGAPLKTVALRAGDMTSRGELVVTAKGLEGGGLYLLTPRLRDGAPLVIDLMPDHDAGDLAARIARGGKASTSNRLRKAGVDAVKTALLLEFARPLPPEPSRLAALVKALPIPHDGVAPLAEAISSAGGVSWDALTPDLELRALPGVFVCGEMLDWEAPTGGYLLSGCLATGLHAGRAAALRLSRG